MLVPEPGRVELIRSVPALFFSATLFVRGIAVALVTALLPACASDRGLPHSDLKVAWRDYTSMPEQRALAIAGDPVRGGGRWVTGASGGHASRAEAEAAALRRCRVSRGARRLQEECVVYAVGDEIVWRGR